jgi:hypothetical protein
MKKLRTELLRFVSFEWLESPKVYEPLLFL